MLCLTYTLPPCITSASVDLFHLSLTNLLVIGSIERFCTLLGGEVLPCALNVKSVDVAESSNAALYEKTLNSYTPASVFINSKSVLNTISLTQFVLLNLYWTRY